MGISTNFAKSVTNTGDLPATVAVQLVNQVVLAYLDKNLKGERGKLSSVIETNPRAVSYRLTNLEEWAKTRDL